MGCGDEMPAGSKISIGFDAQMFTPGRGSSEGIGEGAPLGDGKGNFVGGVEGKCDGNREGLCVGNFVGLALGRGRLVGNELGRAPGF